MKKKKVIVSVINDLSTDQRVHKTCITLQEMGFDVLLVGRKLPNSLPIIREYKTKRMNLFFKKGAAFYAFFNLRLFFFLLFKKADLLVANDLDTLLANRISQKFKRCELVYDTHEYFTEVPELEGRKAKKIWEKIEGKIFPKLKNIITVNDSIAKLYYDKYNKNLTVIRNVPDQKRIEKTKSRKDLGLPEDKKVLILQGSGINIDRGGEEMVESMQFLPDFHLIFVGAGDVIDILKAKAKELKLSNVEFFGRRPYNEMMQFTLNSDLGLTLDKDTNINYRYSLPNKIFDYISAEIPVLSSNLVELKKIITTYKIGIITKNHDPKEIAKTIKTFFESEENVSFAIRNTKTASGELNWEVEKQKFISVYNQFV